MRRTHFYAWLLCIALLLVAVSTPSRCLAQEMVKLHLYNNLDPSSKITQSNSMWPKYPLNLQDQVSWAAKTTFDLSFVQNHIKLLTMDGGSPDFALFSLSTPIMLADISAVYLLINSFNTFYSGHTVGNVELIFTDGSSLTSTTFPPLQLIVGQTIGDIWAEAVVGMPRCTKTSSEYAQEVWSDGISFLKMLTLEVGDEAHYSPADWLFYSQKLVKQIKVSTRYMKQPVGSLFVYGGVRLMGVTIYKCPNRKPVADAGDYQAVDVEDTATVTLDGSGSSDPDGDPLSYLWSWAIEGTWYTATGVNPTITLPVGENHIRLVVNDGTQDSDPNWGLISVAKIEKMIRPVEGYLTSTYGLRWWEGTWDLHDGIDIAGLTGGIIEHERICAPAGGKVYGVGFDSKSGYKLHIRHRSIEKIDGSIAKDVSTFYCHLDGPPSVANDNVVKQGDRIGNVGKTGTGITGPHLHFEVRESGRIVNPLKYVSYSPRPGQSLVIKAKCPVDIAVVDPEGYLVCKNSIEIEETVTYLEEDLDGDGDLDDQIWFCNRKVGDYTIIVVSQPDALPTDTYTVEVTADDTTITLAEDVPVAAIPAGPYVVRVSQDGPPVDVTPPAGLPISIDVYPGRTPNQIYLGKNYTIYVGVLGSSTFNVSDLDPATVRFGHAGTEARPVRAPTIRDLNGDGRNDALYGFMTYDCQFKAGDTKGVLAGQTTAGVTVTGNDSVVVFF